MFDMISVVAQCVMKLFVFSLAAVFMFNSLYPRVGEIKAVSIVAAVFWFIAATWIPFL
jgi:hypothetical protein